MIGGYTSFSDSKLINNGYILSRGGDIRLADGFDNSDGTIVFERSLTLDGTFTTDRLGSLTRTSVTHESIVMATGTFNNTGRTTDVYTAFGGAGRTQIRALVGGTLTSSGDATLSIYWGAGTISKSPSARARG